MKNKIKCCHPERSEAESKDLRIPFSAVGNRVRRFLGFARNDILFAACILVSVLLLCGCSETNIYYANPTGTLAGVDVSKAVVVEGMDTHGGFHGDGETFQKLQFPQEPEFPENWQDLPMSEDFHTLLYGGQRETDSYPFVYQWSGFHNDTGEPIFPEVEKGKWFFYDRHPRCTDPYDVEAVFDRPSKNFTAALWDGENLVMYYFEWDS